MTRLCTMSGCDYPKGQCNGTCWNEERMDVIGSNGNDGEHYDKTVVDMVNRPPHYTAHPSGIECIQVTEHMTFCIGNAIKYLWRVGLKSDDSIQDLQKAKWYIEREIKRREKAT